MTADYVYDAEVVRVIDGDSFELLIDVGFRWTYREIVRLAGVDTPEKIGKTKAKGLAAKAFVEGLMPPGTMVLARTHMATKQQEKFGRWLADIQLADGRDLALELIRAGHAKEYHGGKRS
jgi:micrococcal nuclease